MQVFDPKTTVAIITSYPGRYTTPELLFWLLHIGLQKQQILFQTQPTSDVCCAYNTAVELAFTSNATHFIFADRDIRPDPIKTAPFLECDAPIVGCQYPTGTEVTWQGDDNLHTALWRSDRIVLDLIGPPWFEWGYNENKTCIINCVCQMFVKKARQARVRVEMAGWADHLPKHIHDW